MTRQISLEWFNSSTGDETSGCGQYRINNAQTPRKSTLFSQNNLKWWHEGYFFGNYNRIHKKKTIAVCLLSGFFFCYECPFSLLANEIHISSSKLSSNLIELCFQFILLLLANALHFVMVKIVKLKRKYSSHSTFVQFWSKLIPDECEKGKPTYDFGTCFYRLMAVAYYWPLGEQLELIWAHNLKWSIAITIIVVYLVCLRWSFPAECGNCGHYTFLCHALNNLTRFYFSYSLSRVCNSFKMQTNVKISVKYSSLEIKKKVNKSNAIISTPAPDTCCKTTITKTSKNFHWFEFRVCRKIFRW